MVGIVFEGWKPCQRAAGPPRCRQTIPVVRRASSKNRDIVPTTTMPFMWPVSHRWEVTLHEYFGLVPIHELPN